VALPIPNLDDRRFDELVREARDRIAKSCPAWTDFNPSDPGMTLVELMAWLTEVTLYRLNRIPERSYAVFLDMMGVRLRPPEAARTWVVFRPQDRPGDMPRAAVGASLMQVDRGTAVQARRDGGGPPLVFTTLEPLNLTAARPKLVAFTEGEERALIPDLGLDNDPLVTTRQGGQPMTLGAVDGQDAGRAPHLLFLGRRNAAELSPENVVTTAPIGGLWHLDAGLMEPVEIGTEVEWERPIGGSPESALEVTGWRPWIPASDGTLELRRSGRITFQVSERLIARRRAEGAIWLRGRLLKLHPDWLPQLVSLTYRFELPESAAEPPDRICTDRRTPRPLCSEHPMLRPAQAGSGAIELDPFGEEPAAGTALLIGSPVFGRAGAEITIRFNLRAEGPVPGAPPPELRWEMPAGGGRWTLLGRSTADGVRAPADGAGRRLFSDATAALTRSGTVSFVRPDQAAPFTVLGETGWFLRVRLIGGRPHRLFITDIRIAFIDAATPFDLILAENYSQMARLDGRLAAGDPVRPFDVRRDDETAPTLLIGLSDRPANELQRLFLDLRPPRRAPSPPAELGLRLFFAFAPGSASRPQTAWQYSCNGGWEALTLTEDNTRDLATRGTVAFVAPADWSEAELSYGSAYWLRVRLDPLLRPEERPKLAGIATNCVEADNAELIWDTTLAIAATEGNWQRVDLPGRPVLPGLQLAVRELDDPTPEALAELRSQDAIMLEEATEAGRPGAVLVVWQEVSGFFQSDATSRHYVVDYIDGTITFGDGRHGRRPPHGANRIKLLLMRRGGGSAGNVAAGTIDQLVRPHSGVDRVFNPLPAEGGTDAELIEDALLRGPYALRHRERAVTAEDYERLAREASQSVARARCFSSDGLVQVLIIPGSRAAAPYPGRYLVERVQTYLDARRTIGTRLRVIGPDYVEIEVELGVKLRPAYEARMRDVRERIRTALELLVHPVHGGPDAFVLGRTASDPHTRRRMRSGEPSGWPLGRTLHVSEIYYVVEQVEGVDYADSVALRFAAESEPREILDKVPLPPTALPHFPRIEIRQVT
jgi:hypothetical protein